MVAKRRCYVISITPFDADGNLDEDGLAGHLDRLGDADVGVYVAGGASGEAFTFSDDENRRVLRIAAERLKGRVPVRAMGVEPRSARQAIELAALAAEAGLDAVQVYSLDQGHGLRPTDEELTYFYREVLANVDLPAVLSSHHLAGYVLPVDLIVRLLDEFPGIVGLNVSTPDINYLTRLMEAVGDRVEVLCGGIAQVPAHLMMGGHGYMSSQANLAPRLSQAVVDHFVAGDLPAMSAAFTTVLKLLAADSSYGNTRGLKEALRQLGLPGGHVRPPRRPLPDNLKADVARMLDDLQIRRHEGLAD